MSPLLRQRLPIYVHYSSIFLRFLPSRLQRLGTTPTLITLDLDVGHDVSAAPGGVLPLMSILLASIHPVNYASGTLGLGLAQIFLLRLNRQWMAFIRCRLT
jgi:hypothetical protein